ncbi:MAG: hypothetical protein RIR26_906 [Pseudomonadota bacterium]|jgi:hypothetical protein
MSWKVYSLFALTFAASCKPRNFNDSGTLNIGLRTTTSLPESFCQGPDSSSFLWNAKRVQREIAKLLSEPGYKSSGLATYAEVYQAMTAERDKARCAESGPMVPASPLSQRLNDALADLMSKGFVLSQYHCLRSFKSPTEAIPTIGKEMCNVSQRALKEHWSDLELSMASTAVYLTSVMGIALSALPHVESLWAGDPRKTVDERISALQDFKPTYDAFNLFLSNNLHTVARVLLKEKRIDCKLFELAARAAEITRAPALIFKEMRDRTFALGTSLAGSWPKGLHPLVAGAEAWDPERVFPPFAQEPEALVHLRAHTQASIVLLKNPMLKIFSGKDAATYVTFEGLTCPTRK